jgi:predicted porin
MKSIRIIFASVLLSCSSLFAQSDMDLLNESAGKKHEPVLATFKGTRLANFHTSENPGKRTLEFRISHRFGTLNGGAYNAFGLDGGASIRLGLEYSLDGRLAFGIGRTSYEKTLDGFVKYKLLEQSIDGYMPLSVTLLGGVYTSRIKNSKFDNYGWAGRTSYCMQAIVARKFNERLSLMIAPTYLHYNLVDSLGDKNDGAVIALGGRYKFNARTAITLEYGYRVIKNFTNKSSIDLNYYDSFAVGVDIETGGHVFQMQFVNSFGIVENQFFMRTTDSWKNWGIRLGFNVSRMFFI